MKFLKLSFKNFLSYGNKETSINLNSKQTTNICGTNGSGKSTFLDALHFVLTGKPYRKIKKSQIINSTNKKDCYTKLELEHKNKIILIERGIKPDCFKISIDGKAIDEDSKSIDQQAWLNQFLGINPKTLKHTFIISSSEYKPFLQMTLEEKRLFLEDILNIDMISNILKNLKKQFSIIKEDKKDIEQIIDKLKSNIKIIEDMLAKQNEDKSEKIKEIKK